MIFVSLGCIYEFLVTYVSTFSVVNGKLTVGSYNCKNVKTSLLEIKELCTTCDIILLQETWLLECELSILCSISKEFYGNGLR